MPTYLIHGFRWSRPLIRIHIASNNLDDCCAEWLVSPVSIQTLLNNLYSSYDFIPPCQAPTRHSYSPPSNDSASNFNSHPNGSTSTITPKGSVANSRNLERGGPDDRGQLSGFNKWSTVKVLEQHSERSLIVSQPHAYIGDYILPISLSADIGAEIQVYEERARGEKERLEKESKDAIEAAHAVAQKPAENAEEVVEERKRKGPPVSMRTPTGSGTSTPSRRPSMSKLRREERWLDWICQLRDKLQPNAQMGWYVVVVDDEVRETDEDYVPYEPEYIEVFPSTKAAESRAATATPDNGKGSALSHSISGGLNNHPISEVASSAASPTPDSGRNTAKRRSSVSKLRGVFGLKEKQRMEKESGWEGKKEWEKMQRKQRQDAQNTGKQLNTPTFQFANFSRPSVNSSRPSSARGGVAGKLSKLRSPQAV